MCLCSKAHEVNLLIIPRGVKMCPSKLCQKSFTGGLKRDKTLLCHTKISALSSLCVYSFSTVINIDGIYTIQSTLFSSTKPLYLLSFEQTMNNKGENQIKFPRTHQNKLGQTEGWMDGKDEFSFIFLK